MYRCLAIHLHQAASDPPSPEDSNQQASHVVFFGTFFQCQGCEIPMIHVFITWFFGDLARGALNFQNKSFELVWFYRVSPHLVPLLQQPTAASQEPKESARIEAAKEAEKGIYAGLENLWQKFFLALVQSESLLKWDIFFREEHHDVLQMSSLLLMQLSLALPHFVWIAWDKYRILYHVTRKQYCDIVHI